VLDRLEEAPKGLGVAVRHQQGQVPGVPVPGGPVPGPGAASGPPRLEEDGGAALTRRRIEQREMEQPPCPKARLGALLNETLLGAA